MAVVHAGVAGQKQRVQCCVPGHIEDAALIALARCEAVEWANEAHEQTRRLGSGGRRRRHSPSCVGLVALASDHPCLLPALPRLSLHVPSSPTVRTHDSGGYQNVVMPASALLMLSSPFRSRCRWCLSGMWRRGVWASSNTSTRPARPCVLLTRTGRKRRLDRWGQRTLVARWAWISDAAL